MAKSSGGISALTRALTLLEAFTAETPAMTVSELARRAGRPASSTDRTVRDLIRNRLLEPAGSNRYRLGGRLWELAATVPGPVGLREVAGAFMAGLNRRIGLPIELSVIDGVDALTIERVSARGTETNAINVGDRIPLQRSAPGLVLLTGATGLARTVGDDDSFPSRDERAAARPRDLRGAVESVRRQGYALAEGSGRRGTAGVAAPITGPDGHVLAALGATIPNGSHDVESIARAVTRTAADISDRYAHAHFKTVDAARALTEHLSD